MTAVRPVVALDIDGTLGDYHLHFTRFAREWSGRPMPEPEDINPGISLHQHLGMSKSYYRECKYAFRRGGLKRSMPVYPGSSELTKYIRSTGTEVWITTTRPYLRFDGVDPDTRHWLRRNGIKWDHLLFGERKIRDLCRAVTPARVCLVVDDLPIICEEAERRALTWILRDQPYNRHFETGPERRAKSTEDIRAAFDRALLQWRNQHAV